MSRRRGEPPENQPSAPAPFLSQTLSLLAQPTRISSEFRRDWIGPDLIAGLTVASVAIPQAMAYAAIMELPPQSGLYTAVIGAIVAALWGSSRHIATGPTNTTSLLAFSVLIEASFSPVTDPDRFLLAAGVLAIMAGLFRIVLAVLRFGALVTLASRPVLLGFTTGAGVLIALGQMRQLLGLPVGVSHEPIRMVSDIVSHLDQVNTSCLTLGLATVVFILVLGRMSRRIPSMFLAIAGSAAAVALLDLETKGIAIIGKIPGELPPFTFGARLSPLDVGIVRDLATGSMAVAALGLIEAMAAAQTVAQRTGQALDNNQEFFGQGLANVCCGLFSGFPCSGSFTRTALNHQAGARSRLAGLITGSTVLVVYLIAAPYVRFIPRTALAGLLLVVAWRMIDRAAIRRIAGASRAEAAVMLTTFGATLTLPLEFAVLSGVVLSLAFFVIRSSLPRVYQVVPDATFRHFVHDTHSPVCPQLGVVNIRGALFFGAVYHVEEALEHQIERHPGQNHLVVRMHGVDLCDSTGIEMLERVVRHYRRHAGDVFLIRLRRPVLAIMEDSGFLDLLGRDHVLTQEGAIEQLFESVIDPAVCIYECQQKVFAECQALEKHPTTEPIPRTPRHEVDSAWFLDAAKADQMFATAGAEIIDVRERSEFDRGHLPGARLLPLRELMDRHTEISRDRPVVIVCRSGRRTDRALRILAGLGFGNVRGLRGGYLAWLAEGLPHTAAPDRQGEDRKA